MMLSRLLNLVLLLVSKMAKDKVISLVKQRLRLSNDELDDLILSYVDEIGNRIMHYCNIRRIPNELNFTWSSMVIDALKIEQTTIDEIADSIDDVQNIRIGDTSVSPAKSEGVMSTSKRAINDVVLNYKTDLNRYRKLRW